MKNQYTEFQQHLDSTEKDRRKKYCHFDTPVLPSNYLENILEKDGLVCSHKFYPLIQYFKSEKKYRDGQVHYKKRNIMYSSHRDSAIYQYYCFLLNEMYEKCLGDNLLGDNVIAYRKILREDLSDAKGKCNIDFAREAVSLLIKNESGTAICIDISKFFDNINHKILKNQLCQVINEKELPNDLYNVFKSLTKYSFVRRSDLSNIFKKLESPICSPRKFRTDVRPLVHKNLTDYGIPQGTPISGLLANIYMFDFDLSVKQQVERLGGNYYRYSDDVIIILPHQGLEYQQVLELITNELKKIKLDYSEDKKSIVYYENGIMHDAITRNLKPLQYLGFEFNGKDIFIRSSTIARDLRKTSNQFRAKYRYQKHREKDQTRRQYARRRKNRYMSRAKQLMNGLPNVIDNQIYRIRKVKSTMKHRLKTMMLSEQG